LELTQLYVTRVDTRRALLAKELGLLLSAMVADRQSRSRLGCALQQARELWKRQEGYRLYLVHCSCSMNQRLSLQEFAVTLGCTVSCAETDLFAKTVQTALNEALEYVWAFGSDPAKASALLRGDYEAFLNCLSMFAALEWLSVCGAGEKSVESMTKELARALGHMKVKASHVGSVRMGSEPDVAAQWCMLQAERALARVGSSAGA